MIELKTCDICGIYYRNGYATICSDECMADHIILKVPRISEKKLEGK